MALTMTPATAAAMSAVARDKAGVGSAVLNTSRQIGGSLGIAIMGAVLAHYVLVPRTSLAFPAEFVLGYHRALYVAAGIALAGAAVAVATVRKTVHVEESLAESLAA